MNCSTEEVVRLLLPLAGIFAAGLAVIGVGAVIVVREVIRLAWPDTRRKAP